MQEVLIALVGIVPATLAAVFGYLQGRKSTDENAARNEIESKKLEFRRSLNPGFRELTYPNYGISLTVPVSWSIEDSPALLAGGEFNLVSRYEETAGAIGMNFRLRPVQPNYIKDISAQIENQIETFKKNFPGAEVKDITITGLAGKLFTYSVSTGKRKMLIRLYWIRLVPDVQFQIQCAQYEDAADFDKFWKETDQIIDSIVIAFDSWQSRYKKYISTSKN